MKTKLMYLGIVIILVFTLINPCFGAEDPTKFPSKPITMIIPWGPGGNSDVTCRMLSKLVGDILGQPVVVINKTGGTGTIGTAAIARAPADGYTVGTLTYSQTVILPHIRTVPYKTKEDFDFIMQYSKYIYVFSVLTDSPWKTFKEFIEDARKNPGKLKYSTPGPLGGQHIFMEQVLKLENVKIPHIPVKGGSSAALRQLLGGHLDGALLADAVSPINEGKLRGLAGQYPKRIELLPDVPTFFELGYKKVESPNWQGLIAPKGVDPRILKKLRDAFKQAYEDPRFQELLNKLHLIPTYVDGESFKAIVFRDYDTQGRVLRELGLVKE